MRCWAQAFLAKKWSVDELGAEAVEGARVVEGGL